MSKNLNSNIHNIKTFIISFSFSLLLIMVAKCFVVSKNESNKEKIIPSKNIALFVRKEEPIKTSKASIQEVLVADLNNQKNIHLEIDNSIFNKFYKKEISKQENISYDIENNELKYIYIDSAYNDIDAYDLAMETLDTRKKEDITNKTLQKETIVAENDKTPTKDIELLKNINNKKEDSMISSIELAETSKQPQEQKVAFIEEAKETIVEKNQETQTEAEPLIPILWSNDNETKRNVRIAKRLERNNDVAMAESSVPLASLNKKEYSNPWSVAESGNFSNNQLLQNSLNKEDIKIAKDTLSREETNNKGTKVSQIVRNILIPIPEDILNDTDATPKLVTSEKNKALKEKIENNRIKSPTLGDVAIEEPKTEENIAINTKTLEPIKTTVENVTKLDSQTSEEQTIIDNKGPINSPVINKEKKTIFDSITNIFSTNLKAPEIGVVKNKQNIENENNIFGIKKDKKNKKVTKILPTEIKLSFQPNRSEISGSTLKWLEAFANKVKDDDTVFLEIRIDGTSSLELQQKRLGLLHKILTNKGVSYNKINTVFTSREANSFIIRTVKIDEQTLNANVNNRVKNNSNIYQTW